MALFIILCKAKNHSPLNIQNTYIVKCPNYNNLATEINSVTRNGNDKKITEVYVRKNLICDLSVAILEIKPALG